MGEFVVLIKFSGDNQHWLTGIGSLKGCLSEAASVRKSLGREKFVAMGPGDWESDHVHLQVCSNERKYQDIWTFWNGKEAFKAELRRRKKALKAHDAALTLCAQGGVKP